MTSKFLNLFSNKGFHNMDIAPGSVALYSIPFEEGLFTSIGVISRLSNSHITIEVNKMTQFPYDSKSLPEIYRNDNFEVGVDKVERFKIPLLFLRKVLNPKKQHNQQLLIGLKQDSRDNFFTTWKLKGVKYVFRSITYDCQGLEARETPQFVVTCNLPVKEILTFEDGVTVRPLDDSNRGHRFILKQCPNALLLSHINPEKVVATEAEKWSIHECREYLRSEISLELEKLGCFSYTKYKAVKRTDAGFYAFTEEDFYVDPRAFLGTLYFDPRLNKFRVASFDDEIANTNGDSEFQHTPIFKVDHSLFLGKEVNVSETKKMTGFYNMNLAVNNLLVLLNEGIDNTLFKNDFERALDLMVTKDYPYPQVQSLAQFYWYPMSTDKKHKLWRDRYFWWMSN